MAETGSALVECDATTGDMRPYSGELGGERLIATADGASMLWITPDGYALLRFRADLTPVYAPSGVDALRAGFGRYARKVRRAFPEVSRIAETYPPTNHAWRHVAEVPAESGVGRQLAAIRNLLDGRMTLPEFSRAWWHARRVAAQNGERTMDPLAWLLNEVFHLMDNYAADPEFRSPNDLSEEVIIESIRALMSSEAMR
ncbi:hypothetical protein [Stackebrandtia albiflava]|nr:hypothetical protein [Stackebrandtia albiflava]